MLGRIETFWVLILVARKVSVGFKVLISLFRFDYFGNSLSQMFVRCAFQLLYFLFIELHVLLINDTQ